MARVSTYLNFARSTETDRLFTALAEGGRIEMPFQEMFWGDYHGSLADRFGVRWMFNCAKQR